MKQKTLKYFAWKTVKATKRSHGFKGYAKSYNVEILIFFFNLELKDTESAIKNKLMNLLIWFKSFKFVTTLILEFKKIESDDETKCDTFYLKSKAEIIIKESDTDVEFQLICTTIISNMKKSLGKVSEWINDSVLDHNINISKYNLLVGRRNR